MLISAAQLRAMAKGKPDASNLNSVLVAVNQYGPSLGLGQRPRLAHYLCQILHESGSFRFDKEIWGPTPAQARYDTRTDLGNTKAKDGDGKLYSGRTAMQITGKANYRSFTAWAKQLDPAAPDFVRHPDKANTDPWEGLGPLWYWDNGNPERRSLNRYADDNNIEMITRRINGGMNGFADRLDYYGRVALVLLGYGTSREAVKRFQREHPSAGNPDGVIGGKTRMALHRALAGANPYEEQVPVPVPTPVVPHEVESEVEKKTGWWQKLTGLFGFGGVGGGMLFGLEWQTVAIIAGGVLLALLLLVLLRRQIIGAVKDIRAAVEH